AMAHAIDDDLRLLHGLQPLPRQLGRSGKLAKSCGCGKAASKAPAAPPLKMRALGYSAAIASSLAGASGTRSAPAFPARREPDGSAQAGSAWKCFASRSMNVRTFAER